MDSFNKKIYGLIGYPLGHSFSMNYFNTKFATDGIDAEYKNFEIAEIDDFPSVVAGNPNLCGLNVTIPYKEKVKKYLSKMDDTAAEIGAVNVIKVIRNHKGDISSLKGYNSDCIGFMDAIRSMLTPVHKKALVLGTGGAAKAVAYGLRKLGVEPTFVSRTKTSDNFTYEDLKLRPEIISEHTVIVNTTPLGMFPKVDECPDIPYEYITPQHICFDLVYNPDVTCFMRNCAKYGAQTKNGLEMLLMQAFAAWKIWNQ